MSRFRVPDRRDVFRLGAGVLLFGCKGSSSGSGPDATPVGADATAVGPDAGSGPDGGACLATLDNIEGPFYSPGAPSDADLTTPEMPGVRLTLTGFVLSTTCDPIPGAELDVWQADADGEYDNEGFRLRGILQAADDGSFQLVTIVPGHYLNGDQFRPAHIHVKLRAAGYRPLTTQLYFEGDEFNEGDPWIRDSLILQTVADGDALRAHFEFVLPAA